ncbi:MAG: hypothetical protein NC489_31275 [Ruminococcus flavefaciens]|nr:hypothetical protein [Ruminococcus flavefaciens]
MNKTAKSVDQLANKVIDLAIFIANAGDQLKNAPTFSSHKAIARNIEERINKLSQYKDFQERLNHIYEEGNSNAQ